ncbi:hypothetical protein DMH27_13885 [Raoultella planticola]|nr:hypothetical protein [Raoultella planticola]
MREAKRARKNLDLICANDVSQPDQGFNSDSNALHLSGRMEISAYHLSVKNSLANYYSTRS